MSFGYGLGYGIASNPLSCLLCCCCLNEAKNETKKLVGGVKNKMAKREVKSPKEVTKPVAVAMPTIGPARGII